MNFNKAKTIVAKTLRKHNLSNEKINASMDMTRDEAIITAANIIEYYEEKQEDCPFAVLQDNIYIPEI